MKLLGLASYQARERAGEALAARGLAAVPALLRAAKHDDPEVAARSRRLVQVIFLRRRAAADATVQAYLYPCPFLDALWYDEVSKLYKRQEHDPLARLAYRWLSPGYASQPHDRRDSDPHGLWRTHSRRFAVNCLLAGVPVEVLQLVFYEMHRRDRVFLGLPLAPPYRLQRRWWSDPATMSRR